MSESEGMNAVVWSDVNADYELAGLTFTQAAGLRDQLRNRGYLDACVITYHYGRS